MALPFNCFHLSIPFTSQPTLSATLSSAVPCSYPGCPYHENYDLVAWSWLFNWCLVVSLQGLAKGTSVVCVHLPIVFPFPLFLRTSKSSPYSVSFSPSYPPTILPFICTSSLVLFIIYLPHNKYIKQLTLFSCNPFNSRNIG